MKGKDALTAARKRVEELERESRRLNPRDIPPVIREKVERELRQAQREYQRLDFLWNDAAPSHQTRLAAINQRNREFWRQR